MLFMIQREKVAPRNRRLWTCKSIATTIGKQMFGAGTYQSGFCSSQRRCLTLQVAQPFLDRVCSRLFLSVCFRGMAIEQSEVPTFGAYGV